MLSCEVDFFQLIKAVLADSGRGIFHRGHYEDCLDRSDMKYAIVEFGAGGADSGAFMAMCLPRHCSDSLISKLIDGLL